MKGLYKFFWDCGRQGELEGLFIAEEKEVKDIIGQKVYFGEVLGKHSEVYGTIEEGEIELVTHDIGVISIISDYSLENGFNPLDYINED